MKIPEGKTLVFTDPHIHKNSLEELSQVFTEICDIAKTEKPRWIVCAGDYYDDSTVTPEVLTFGTLWAKQIAELCEVFIMLTGNHTTVKSGETSVDYLRHVKGLIDVREEAVIGNTLYGHFCTEKSEMCYNGILTGNKYERHTDLLKDYKLVVLGHQHWGQNIEPNIIHLPSCRYVTFGEKDENKYIGIVENDEFRRIDLKSVYPMIDIHSLEEAEAIDNPLLTKVRFVVDDFNYLKEHINEIEALKTRFFRYKIKMNFVEKVNTEKKIDQYKKKNLQYQVYCWIQNIKDKDVQNLLIEELKDTYYVS